MSLRVFCGSSKINPCKASCSAEANSKCYDTVWFASGGEYLENGAVCMRDFHKGKERFCVGQVFFINACREFWSQVQTLLQVN